MDTLSLAREYLTGSQSADGSWGSGDPFVCARAMYALCGDMPDETLINGLNYLECCQAPDGHFSRVTNMYTDASNTAYAMIVLNKFDYGKASLPISKGIMWLLENQSEDGSWGANTKKKAYTTTLCLRALYTFYLSGLARFAKGLEYSLGYIKELKLADEPVSHVYAPILNLKRIGYLDDATAAEFIEYAAEAVTESVACGKVADAAYLLGTLKALGETEVSAILEEWLTVTQNEDGGFGKELGSASEPNWTALVMLAIQNKL
jgi:prenyltransferase beta subunit